MTDEELQELHALIKEYAGKAGSIWEDAVFADVVYFVNAMLAKREGK